MSKALLWEEEYIFLNMTNPNEPGFATEHHLKVVLPRPDHPRPYKVSVAWISRQDKRKYAASVAVGKPPYDKQTFRSLKAAKAWCLTVYSLEQ